MYNSIQKTVNRCFWEKTDNYMICFANIQNDLPFVRYANFAPCKHGLQVVLLRNTQK